MKRLVSCLLLLALLSVSSAKAQTTPDPALLAEINAIKAIDNHAHPLPFLKEGKRDVERGVIPDSIPPQVLLPARLRPDNPEYLEAWRTLYGYKHGDMSDAHMGELAATKRRVMNEKWAAYPAWVLDQLGIETMLTNAETGFGSGIAVGRGAGSASLPVGEPRQPLPVPAQQRRGEAGQPPA